jgi:hypothetical protein
MKNFRDFIKEEVLPSVQVADGGLDIEKPAVRAAINAAIAGVVSQPAVTPYVVFNRLSKLLAQYHIVLPKRFLEGDKGVEVFEIRQFGHRMGMTDGGEFVNHVPSTHYLFLQYGIISPFGITYAKPVVGGMFRVSARLVDKDELDKLLDMAEISLKEDAECRQMTAKAMAPKEPMHDITSDEKKKGNKEAVATSQKGLDEALSTAARELTLHADNDSQLHRSSHQPIIKNLQRKHAKGAYDHEKATKLWKYHADRAAKSYEKQHGGKFSVADRKAAASHFADSARDEHGFGSVKEEQIDELKKTTLASYIKQASHKKPIKSASSSAVQVGMGDSAAYKTHKKRTKGIELAVDKLAKEETLDEKAPPGAKFERMVKHIKKGYSKDGLTSKEKSIAYATAWKAKKREEQGE